MWIIDTLYIVPSFETKVYTLVSNEGRTAFIIVNDYRKYWPAPKLEVVQIFIVLYFGYHK